MYREDLDAGTVMERLALAVADLYQGCGSMSVASLEILCRRINMLRYKLYSFKGGRYGKEK